MRGLIISDIHSGSVWSPVVSGARTDYCGGRICMNGLQRGVLGKRWREMANGGPYDYVVVNGDCVDGLNPKSKGVGLWTCIIDLQAENCAKLLSMIKTKPNAPFYIVGGTPYHTNENPGADKLVAEKLVGLGVNAEYRGLEFILEHKKQRFHFSHHANDSMYEGTPLSKEILFSYKYGMDVTGMFRGHKHHYWLDTDGFRFCAMLPPWKCRDEFVQMRGFRFARTQIGWVELITDGREKWEVVPHIWNLSDQINTVFIGKETETFEFQEEKERKKEGVYEPKRRKA